MTAETSAPQPSSSPLGDLLAVFRYHIVIIAMVAALTFGWLITGQRFFALTLIVGLDWFLINLMNRVTDLEEDRRNGIQGVELVAARGRTMTVLSYGLMFGSFAGTHFVWPELTGWRVLVQVIGLGYNYNIVPTLSGMKRFKEIYFLKNFMSAMLFVLTCFVYPLTIAEGSWLLSMNAVICLALFFVPFELTYEILYDLRDLEGDRAEGVPTYPVIHGAHRARQIIDALLFLCCVPMVVALAMGWIGVREGLMLAAPIIQLVFYRPRYRRGLTPSDCILLTHLGSGLLVFYLISIQVWIAAGLPENIFLVGP